MLALANSAQAATLFIVSLRVKAWFADLGINNVKELDWWDSAVVKGVEFNFTPVQHWSSRGLDVHWGTFNLTGEPLDQPPQDLAAARVAANITDDDFFLP